jgi:hypothetical protein
LTVALSFRASPMLGISFFLALGALFGALAGAMAYVILYGEYSRHFPKDPRRARRMALQGALIAFLVFVGLAAASGYVIGHYVNRLPE